MRWDGGFGRWAGVAARISCGSPDVTVSEAFLVGSEWFDDPYDPYLAERLAEASQRESKVVDLQVAYRRELLSASGPTLFPNPVRPCFFLFGRQFEALKKAAEQSGLEHGQLSSIGDRGALFVPRRFVDPVLCVDGFSVGSALQLLGELADLGKALETEPVALATRHDGLRYLEFVPPHWAGAGRQARVSWAGLEWLARESIAQDAMLLCQ